MYFKALNRRIGAKDPAKSAASGSAVGRVDRSMDLVGADRVAHADDRIGRVLEGVLRVRPQAARGDVDGVDAVGVEELRDLNCLFHVQAVLQEFVGAEADEDREERADLGAAEGNRLGEEAAAILETAAVFIGALVERRGEELSTSSFDFDNITILRLSSNNIAMFIFSDIIIHGLCRFIYNLVAVLYNDILLFKNMKRQGAFWPSGVDFGLYYNNFALILQQSCAPGLFPRPGRAAGGRVH